MIEDNLFEWNLMVLQSRDSKIKDITQRLESAENPPDELQYGLVYKKHSTNLLFLIFMRGMPYFGTITRWIMLVPVK